MVFRSNFGTGEARYQAMAEADYPGGVVVDPTPITSGEEITILYHGPLATEGAGQVYLHLGYGDPRSWEDVRDLRMSRTGWGWVKTLEVTGRGHLNFCFRDDRGRWDNNEGRNWSYLIHEGRL